MNLAEVAYISGDLPKVLPKSLSRLASLGLENPELYDSGPRRLSLSVCSSLAAPFVRMYGNSHSVAPLTCFI